jgi:hypothetical protein
MLQCNVVCMALSPVIDSSGACFLYSSTVLLHWMSASISYNNVCYNRECRENRGARTSLRDRIGRMKGDEQKSRPSLHWVIHNVTTNSTPEVPYDSVFVAALLGVLPQSEFGGDIQVFSPREWQWTVHQSSGYYGNTRRHPRREDYSIM